jgi:aromatic-L-amino-acid decarboxylase
VRDEPGWELCAPRPFSVVCFRREGSDEENEALLARVNATGMTYLTHTRLRGRLALRIAVGNVLTRERHLAGAWELVRLKLSALLSSEGPTTER